MAKDWVMVRLDRRTHELLEQLRQVWLRSYDQGRRLVDQDSQGRVSHDQVIAELAYAELRHLERGRRASDRRTARRQQACIHGGGI